MQTSISQFLAVDTNSFPDKEQIVIGDRSNEGGFLTHYFLNLCQKQSRPVLFLALSQSFTHYNSVAQKLGSNLLTACNETKNLKFIEGLKFLGNCFDPTSSGIEDTKPFLDFVIGNYHTLLQYVQTAIDAITNDCPLGPIIIIDDLSILLSVCASHKDVMLFYSGLVEIVNSLEGSLITYSSLEKEDDQLEDLWSFMSHSSSLRFEVSPLSSGFCKDVHGQLKVEWRDKSFEPRKGQIKQSQFKVSDKSVDFFASETKMTELHLRKYPHKNKRHISYVDDDNLDDNLIILKREKQIESIVMENNHLNEAESTLSNNQEATYGFFNGEPMSIPPDKLAEKCPVCRVEFECEADLDVHLDQYRSFDVEMPDCFRCNICKQVSVNVSQFKIHLKIHSGDRKYKCDQCDKSYRSSSDLRRHQRSHQDDRPFVCHVCFKSFKDSASLYRHNKIHTEKYQARNYQCSKCSKSFTDNHGLKRHEKIHLAVKPFECKVCGKSFTEASAFRRHQKIHVGVRNHECWKCKRCFLEKAGLARHLRTVCGEPELQDENNANVNMPVINIGNKIDQNQHFEKPKDDLLPAEDTVLLGDNFLMSAKRCIDCGQDLCNEINNGGSKCSLCKENNRSNEYEPPLLIVASQIDIDHKQDFLSLQPTEKRLFSPHKFQCTVCNKTFSHSSSLRRHKTIHTGVKPYPCPRCHKRFRDSSNLCKHKKICFVISTSGKTCERPSVTDKGGDATADQEPYTCWRCFLCFLDEASLEEHLRTCLMGMSYMFDLPSTKGSSHLQEMSQSDNIDQYSLTKYDNRNEWSDLESGPLYFAGIANDDEMDLPVRFQTCISSPAPSDNLENQYSHTEVNTTEACWGELKCEYSEQMFEDEELLKKHLQIHTRRTDFVSRICRECGLEIPVSGLQKCLQLKAVTCLSCEKNICTSYKLNRYVRIYLEKLDYSVPIIENKSFVENGLTTRIARHEFPCSFCPKVFRINSLLTKHMRVHSTDRPFKCKFCERSYKTTNSRNRHERTQHVEFNDSGKDFLNQTNLRIDMREACKTDLICKDFKNVGQSQPDYKDETDEMPNLKIESTKESFSQDSLTKELTVSFRLLKLKKPSSKSTRLRNFYFNTDSTWSLCRGTHCWYCDRKFSSHQDLIKHRLRHRFTRAFQCCHCFLRFTHKYYWKCHITKYHGGKNCVKV